MGLPVAIAIAAQTNRQSPLQGIFGCSIQSRKPVREPLAFLGYLGVYQQPPAKGNRDVVRIGPLSQQFRKHDQAIFSSLRRS